MTRPAWRAVWIALAALLPFVPMLLRGEMPAFRDHRDYFIPLRESTAAALRAFDLPLWNALSGSGEPWLANPQMGVFYPPAWIIAALPFKLGYVVFLALHLAILGLGWRHLMLRWSRDDVATLGATALMLSGPVLSLLELSTILATLAWIPLLLAFALEGRRDAVVRDAATVVLCFLGGEPLLAAIGAALYAVVRVVRERRACLSPTVAVAALSLLLSGAQLLPFLESLRGSDRSQGLDPAAALAQSMAPTDWLVVPLSPLLPWPEAKIRMASQHFLPSLFVSPLVALLPFALPVLWRTRALPARACVGWLALLVASAFVSAGSHLILTDAFYLSVGLTVSRYPVKFALFGLMAMVALGSICLDRLLTATKRTSVLAVLVIAIVAAASISLSPVRDRVAVLLLVGWVVVTAMIVVAPSLRTWGLAVAALLVCADSISSSRFLLVSEPLTLAVAPHESVLRKDRKVARLEQLDLRRDGAALRASRAAWLGGYLNLRNDQFDVMTAAPVVDARYLGLIDYALSRPRIDILDFLGVGYLLTTREIAQPGFREVSATDGVRVYERDAGFPSVTIWERVVPEQDATAAYESLYSEAWSARDQIVVTGDVPLPAADAASGPVGEARIVEVTWRSLRAEVESPRGGVVAVSQRDAPGWSVNVDGVAASPLLVNGLFRGVAVSRGRHVVEWRYFPHSLAFGFLLSVTGVTVASVSIFRSRGARIA